MSVNLQDIANKLKTYRDKLQWTKKKRRLETATRAQWADIALVAQVMLDRYDFFAIALGEAYVSLENVKRFYKNMKNEINAVGNKYNIDLYIGDDDENVKPLMVKAESILNAYANKGDNFEKKRHHLVKIKNIANNIVSKRLQVTEEVIEEVRTAWKTVYDEDIYTDNDFTMLKYKVDDILCRFGNAGSVSPKMIA